MLKDSIILLRPYQYTKNLFIFAPAIFAFKINDISLLLRLIIAFMCFCLICSSIYIINDIFDKNQDKQHPIKKNRPIASGKISVYHALIFAFILFVSGLGGGTIIDQKLITPILCYASINILYTIKLKHIPILDVVIIAIGFVLRLFIGAIVVDTPLSHWIIIITFLLAIFLALAKRRDDVVLYNQNGAKSRLVIDGYNKQFLDIAMSISGTIIIIAYILYTIDFEVMERFSSEYLYLTSIFVFLGILRYLQISFVENRGGDPSRILLKDRFLQIVIIGYLISFFGIIYLEANATS